MLRMCSSPSIIHSHKNRKMRKLMKRKKKKNSQKNGSTMFQENVRRKETWGEESAAAAAMWDLGSPLFDSHELVSVSHLIDRHLMALPSSLGDGGSKQLSRKFSLATSGRSQAVVVPALPSPTRSTGGRDNNDEAIAAIGGGSGSSDDRRWEVGGMLGFLGKKLGKSNEEEKNKIGRSGKQQRSAKGKKSVGLIIACFGRKKS